MQKIITSNHPAPKQGFTLVELIIVITLLALFATFGAINYVKLRERHLLENTAERIASELKSAKTSSINGTKSLEHGISFQNHTRTSFNRTTGTFPTFTTEDPISLPNGITVFKPNNGSVTYALRTGEPTFNQNLNASRFIILQSSSFQIQIDFDAQGNPILGKPMPLP